MTVKNIMSQFVAMLEPEDKVRDALRIMHEHRVRYLPVVIDGGNFIGLIGVRQVVHLLLPKAAWVAGGLSDLSFMPDELGELYHRLYEVGDQPVVDYLEPVEELLFCTPERGRTPEEQLQSQEAMLRLESAIQELPARQREAFMLRTFEGLDVAGTATAMGVSAGSVKTHYSRAVHTLRDKLGEVW